VSKKLKKKSIIMIGIEIVCLVLLGVLLTVMQTNLAVKDQQRDTQEKMSQMGALIADADEEAQQTTESFDEFYKSKAASMAYAAIQGADFEYTDAKLGEYKELLNVNNVLILDNQGNVVAAAQDSPADFTYSRFNQLRTVFKTKQLSQPFEVKTGGQCYRYYGAIIDSQHMAVIEQSPEELNLLLNDISTWKGILGNISVGLDGYAFAVSEYDYTFLYHPDEAMIGQDALDKGVAVEDLEDGKFVWMTINGERMYCGITKAEDAYIVFAVLESEIIASRNVTVAIILFVFFAVMTLVIAYAIFIMIDEERNGGSEGSYTSHGRFFYNKMIGRKIMTISAVGLIGILIISLYMQTLFALSRQSMSNSQRVAEVQQTIDVYAEDVALITEQYNTRYLNKCRFAAHVLSAKPELRNKTDLAELSKILEIHSINVFDSTGLEIASNTPHRNFRISNNPEDQSYEFNIMLNGAEYFIQEAQPDDASGEYYQYIAVALIDAEDNADGFVQLGILPIRLENLLKNTNIESALDGVSVGVNGFAFAVNKEDQTFAYYPDERMQGKKVLDYGMDENELHDGYNDYITIDGETYYTSSLESEHYYIYVAVPEGEMSGAQLPITMMAVGVSFLCLLIVCCLLMFSRKPDATETAENDGSNDERMIDVRMPDGSVKKTESAASRWDNISIGWGEKTPEQKFFTVLKGIFAVMAVIICLSVVFSQQFFDQSSIFLYVISGKWERGFNIFAITSCVMIICVASVVTMIVRKILQLLANTFGARGETVCRLLSSFVKYISVIAIMYYCFALFGVDTATLLASAGILSLVIGLGAKSLVSDIIAGLFIIFEGEFRVGDIVTVGDWRGTVVEIGVRTTKIEDGSKNIKIINNSNVSGVINMTRKHSFAMCDVGIEYGESLERVENILREEFPNIRRHLPAIQDGPFYKGVVSLGDNSVNIRIMVQCAEGDRFQLLRDLNREMKLIFDKHDINIPFPQVVLNQPPEFKESTAWERRKAEEFNTEQKEKTKDLQDETGQV